MKNSKKNVIKLLTSAALALPGIQAVKAESPPSAPHAEFRYTTYDESGVRYNINVYQAMIQAPYKDKWLFAFKSQRDLQTGASYVFTAPQTFNVRNGNPAVLVPIVTGASITEIRDAANLTTSYYFPQSVASIGLGYSTEDDYLSRSISGEWRKPFRKKATEISLGVGYSDDKVRPTPSSTANRTTIDSIGARSDSKAVISLRHDVSPKTTTKWSVNYSHQRGYLSDPYKRVVIYGDARSKRPGSSFIPGIAGAGITLDYDRRPGSRESVGFEGTIRRYIEKMNSSINVQYSYARDTWDLVSNALELSYFQPFKETWQIVPLFRYYTQSEARFYAPIFKVRNGAPFPTQLLSNSLESSSDPRLSNFGTFNSQLTLTKRFSGGIELSFTGGSYISHEWLHIGRPARLEISNPTINYSATYFAVNTAIDFD